MRITPPQIIALTAEPGDKLHSMLQSLYAKAARGDLPARQKAPRATGGRDELYFNLTDACMFKVLYALGQVGIAAATPMNQVALVAMLNWSDVRPQIGNY